MVGLFFWANGILALLVLTGLEVVGVGKSGGYGEKSLGGLGFKDNFYSCNLARAIALVKEGG